MIFVGNTLQNGPDAVALYIGNAVDFPIDTPVTSVNLIDALVYGTGDPDDLGLIQTLLIPGGQVQLDENENLSSETVSTSRCSASTRDGTAFTSGTTPTPDSVNAVVPCP